MYLAVSVCLLLSEWISFILVSVPLCSRRTFVELLIGCMLDPEGWGARTTAAICREAHCTALIERAHGLAADLNNGLLQLFQLVLPPRLSI